MLMFYLPQLNFLLALASLGLLAITVILAVDLFVLKGKYGRTYVAQYFWPVVLLVTVGSVAMSLLYSEYFGFIPCSLCWLQRIAIYPQALMGLMAFKLRDEKYAALYGIGLSAFGFLVAIYQYIYQMIPQEKLATGILPCLADGSNADCAAKIIDEFGFVTFPFLSAVTFAFLIVLYLYRLRLR